MGFRIALSLSVLCACMASDVTEAPPVFALSNSILEMFQNKAMALFQVPTGVQEKLKSFPNAQKFMQHEVMTDDVMDLAKNVVKQQVNAMMKNKNPAMQERVLNMWTTSPVATANFAKLENTVSSLDDEKRERFAGALMAASVAPDLLKIGWNKLKASKKNTAAKVETTKAAALNLVATEQAKPKGAHFAHSHVVRHPAKPLAPAPKKIELKSKPKLTLKPLKVPTPEERKEHRDASKAARQARKEARHKQ